MKKNFLLVCGAAIALAITSVGCNVTEMKIGYLTPAGGVYLGAHSSVQVVALGNDATVSSLAASLTDAFRKSRQMRVSETNPDYWIVLQGKNKSLGGVTDKQFITRRNESSGGWQDYIDYNTINSSAFTKYIGIAIYRVKDLTPIHYTDIPLHDADFTTGHTRGAQEYNKQFTQLILGNLKRSFLIEKIEDNTEVPKKAEEAMLTALEAGNSAEVIKNYPGNTSLDQIIADFHVAKQQEREDEDLFEKQLCDYYVLALAKEMDNFDEQNLKELHAQHILLLKNFPAGYLEDSIIHTLARIERKLEILQARQ